MKWLNAVFWEKHVKKYTRSGRNICRSLRRRRIQTKWIAKVICSATKRLETKVKIYWYRHDRVLCENEWGNDPVRRSGSKPKQVRCTGRAEPPNGDSGRVEKERVCKVRIHRQRSMRISSFTKEEKTFVYTRSFANDPSLAKIFEYYLVLHRERTVKHICLKEISEETRPV
jgi:hypothetical protein